MPVLTYDNDSSSRDVVKTLTPFRQEAMLNNQLQLQTIKQYITGKQWTVDYYNQVTAQDSEISQFDPNAPITQSQVALLKNMTLYVTEPLAEVEASEVRGAATVISGIVPNAGDSFVADILGKRMAIFSVTAVEKKTYNLDNVYDIQYSLYLFVDENTSALDTLNGYIVKTYYYENDFLDANGGRVLLEEEYHLKKTIMEALPEITEYYLKNMVDHETRHLSIPGQSGTIIDVMASEYFMSMTNVNDSPYAPMVSRVNLGESDYISRPTLWNALKHADHKLLKACAKKIRLVDSWSVTTEYRLRGLAYIGIDAVVYPDDVDQNIGADEPPVTSATYTLSEVANAYRANKDITPNLIPDIDLVNNYYVFTEAFYNDDVEAMTVLEKLVTDYLKTEPVDKELVVALIDEYKFMNRLQQFYFVPVIITLMRYAIINTYSVI